jgi:LDH2 family malate/lactate/ureidoglycolate dehydrogenase
MIVVATTNGLPTMGWFGGLDRILSLNPVGVFIPAADERPIVMDTSFGATARGKIVIHRQKGMELPEGWAYDADGNPTVDPVVALDGLIQPAGGYKGTSMALLMGVLAGVLSGASYGTDLGDFESGPKPGQDGQFVLALDVGAFEDVGGFKQRMDEVIREIRASRPAPGVERVRLPGELAAETAARYRREGVPLTTSTVEALTAVAEKAGLDTGSLAEA